MKTATRNGKAAGKRMQGNGRLEGVEVIASTAPLLKLDFGCGPNKREGFEGVDQYDFPGVDHVMNINGPWPWADGSVEEAHASHFVEHLEWNERIRFVNELWRVLIPGGKFQMIVPDWGSGRAYGDLTHRWPPVSTFWFYYLSKDWRMSNAPHDDFTRNPLGYKCDFEVTWGYNVHPEISMKHAEAQGFAFNFYKEAIQDVVATFSAKK